MGGDPNLQHELLVVADTSEGVVLRRVPIHVLSNKSTSHVLVLSVSREGRTPTTDVWPLKTVVGSITFLAFEYELISLGYRMKIRISGYHALVSGLTSGKQ